MNSKYDRWSDDTVVECEKCFFYGGKSHGEVRCKAGDCFCMTDISSVDPPERRINGNQNKQRNP